MESPMESGSVGLFRKKVMHSPKVSDLADGRDYLSSAIFMGKYVI